MPCSYTINGQPIPLRLMKLAYQANSELEVQFQAIYDRYQRAAQTGNQTELQKTTMVLYIKLCLLLTPESVDDAKALREPPAFRELMKRYPNPMRDALCATATHWMDKQRPDFAPWLVFEYRELKQSTWLLREVAKERLKKALPPTLH